MRPRTLDAKILLGSLSVLALLCAYRFYSYWTTGFFVSDEYGYYYDAVHAVIYSDRWFFGWMNIFLFKALGITNVDAFSYLLPFYLFFWTGTTLIVFYKLLKLLGFNEVVTSLALLSSFVLVSFILLSLGFLTEPVGLCMAILGIYFMARYMKSKSAREIVILPLLSACFFGFAAGTREPYNAFLIGGVAIILMLAFARRNSSMRTERMPKRALLAISVLAFVLPSMFFLFVPTQAYSQQVAPISSQLVQSVVSNPQTSAPPVTVNTVTVTANVTRTFTTVVSNTTTTLTTTTMTTTVSTSTISQAVPFYRQFIVTNTLLIFLGGIILGWGPICIVLALIGFLMLLNRSLRGNDVTSRFMLLMSVFALGSYFVVSFINASSPYYFTFQDYSTVIRFSDTALPAYFLAAPIFLSLIAKNRKRMLALAAVSIAMLILLVPIYETYAASNFNTTTSGNPFAFGYRSDAVVVRDYLSAQPVGGPVNVAGLPYGWVFTPGVQDLGSVSVYALINSGQAPYLNYTRFLSLHWSSFYIFSLTPASPAQGLPQFLADPLVNATSSSLPYAISNSHVVLEGTGFVLLQVDVVWH